MRRLLALALAACGGIAAPVPDATDAGTSLEDAHHFARPRPSAADAGACPDIGWLGRDCAPLGWRICASGGAMVCLTGVWEYEPGDGGACQACR